MFPTLLGGASCQVRVWEGKCLRMKYVTLPQKKCQERRWNTMINMSVKDGYAEWFRFNILQWWQMVKWLSTTINKQKRWQATFITDVRHGEWINLLVNDRWQFTTGQIYLEFWPKCIGNITKLAGFLESNIPRIEICRSDHEGTSLHPLLRDAT